MVDGIYTDNPDRFIPVEYWLGGGPEVTWCGTRASYYGVPYTPFLVLDGILNAGANSGLYPNRFADRKAIPTDVTIDISGGPVYSPINWEFTAHVCVEAGGEAKEMRIYLIEVNDDYPASPTYSRNTFRKETDTEDVSLAAGECADVVRKMDFDSTAMSFSEGVRVVAWAQDPVSPPPGSVTAEVFQAEIMVVEGLPWFYAGFESGDFSEWSRVGP